ncbi:MAG: 23S rRNA (pseudouridine(1915)-N(3))-methyltransferase RlmH [Chromatiaceae bacterium]
MLIHLITIGDRMPGWVEQGYAEYAKRLNGECRIRLVQIPAGRRGKNADVARLQRDETTRMLAAVPKRALVIALEVQGRGWSTEQLAGELERWLAAGRDVALLVGGPEGLAEPARKAAELQWSLSPLTLPHPLVRVVVAEQIYRAWSLLRNHPYHRA